VTNWLLCNKDWPHKVLTFRGNFLTVIKGRSVSYRYIAVYRMIAFSD